MSYTRKNQHCRTDNADPDWQTLYKIGGVAALLAGVIFRRNLGAEVALFNPQTHLTTISDWFALLQNNPLLGLAYLNFFDLVDYALVGLMFLALYGALKQTNRSLMTVATALGLVGIGIYGAANTAFTMLALSDQYATATTEAQRTLLLAAGQAVFALSAPGSIGAGTGIYLSFLCLAIAGLLTSVVMVQSAVFSHTTAYMGILASSFDLVDCITFAFAPVLDAYLLATAGLFLMIWHILIGWRLLRLGESACGGVKECKKRNQPSLTVH
jgi:hypothetical protein